MTRLFTLASLAATVAALLAAVEVRAEMAHWSFDNLAPGDRAYASSTGSPFPPYGTGGGVMDFSYHFDRASTLPIIIRGPTVIPVVDAHVFGGDRITFSNDRFLIGLQVDNPAANYSFFNFVGYLNGTADAIHHTSTVTASFPGGPPMLRATDSTLIADLTLSPLRWNARGGDFEGTFYVHFDISPASSPAATPEPSCLVLAGMGLVAVAGAAWRKCRQQAGVLVHNRQRG